MQSNSDGRPPHVRSIAKDRSLWECLVMARTISSSISGPVNLVNPAQDKPLVITRKGAVISSGTGVDGIDGTAAAVWTITNSGTVLSAGGFGISLAGAGTVTNGPLRADNALISGSAGGVAINGAGTVNNTGLISSSYGFGVELRSGGTVTNTGAASAILGGFSGVEIAGANGTVTNEGTITGSFDGVDLFAGGRVTNSGIRSAISGGTYGVYVAGAAGTVTNEGTITGANNSVWAWAARSPTAAPRPSSRAGSTVFSWLRPAR